MQDQTAISVTRGRAIVTGFSALVAGVGAGAAANADDSDVIRVAVSPFEAQFGAYYALELGFFKSAGLNVEIQQIGAGAAIAAAVVGGSIQVGASNPMSLAGAVQRGIKLLYFAPGYMYDATTPPIDALAVALNAPIQSAKDLNGKTVAGVGVKSVDQISIYAWVDQHGGDSKTLTFVELGQTTMADALVDGRVAGANIGEPALSVAINAGKVRILGRSWDAIGSRYLTAGWFATPQWLERNSDAAKRFGIAINKGATWAVNNPERAALLQQKYLKVSYSRAHEYHARSLDPAMIQPLLDAAYKYKALERPLDAHEMIWRG